MASEQPGLPTPLTGAYAALKSEHATLISEILSRRDPALHASLTRDSDVSEQQVGEVEQALYREFVQQLREDWEPSEYGKQVDDAIGSFVKRFLIERNV